MTFHSSIVFIDGGRKPKVGGPKRREAPTIEARRAEAGVEFWRGGVLGRG